MFFHHVVPKSFRKEMSAMLVVVTAIIAPVSAKIAPAATPPNCNYTTHAFPPAPKDTLPTMVRVAWHAQITARSAIPQPSAFLAYLGIYCC